MHTVPTEEDPNKGINLESLTPTTEQRTVRARQGR
jgi:hypothetical protein